MKPRDSRPCSFAFLSGCRAAVFLVGLLLLSAGSVAAQAIDFDLSHPFETLEPRLHDVFEELVEAIPFPGSGHAGSQDRPVRALAATKHDALHVVG